MRCALAGAYGPPDVIQLVTRPDPSPRAGELLIRVEAASVDSADARVRAGSFPRGFGLPARLIFGWSRPRQGVLGVAFAGEVVGLGAGVSGWRVGERVCGLRGMKMGGHAELLCAPARAVARVPEGLSAEDVAGLLFGGSTAWHFLMRLGQLQPGQRVLVNGASGAVGSLALQVARWRGAKVCGVSSAKNRALVLRLGAEEHWDHAQGPVAELGPRFDLVLDAVGHLNRHSGRALLAPGGKLALAVADLEDTLLARGPVLAGPAPDRPEELAPLLGLAAEGQLRPVVEAVWPLERVVEAHRLVDSGRKVGHLVLRP